MKVVAHYIVEINGQLESIYVDDMEKYYVHSTALMGSEHPTSRLIEIERTQAIGLISNMAL